MCRARGGVTGIELLGCAATLPQALMRRPPAAQPRAPGTAEGAARVRGYRAAPDTPFHALACTRRDSRRSVCVLRFQWWRGCCGWVGCVQAGVRRKGEEPVILELLHRAVRLHLISDFVPVLRGSMRSSDGQILPSRHPPWRDPRT